MMRLSLILLSFLAGIGSAAVPGIPDVVYRNARVTGTPAVNHRVLKQEMTVIQTEECSATPSGGTMKVSTACGYLRGVYYYRYVPKGGKTPVDLYMGFGLQGKAGSHTFMVSAPMLFAVAE